MEAIPWDVVARVSPDFLSFYVQRNGPISEGHPGLTKEIFEDTLHQMGYFN